MKAVCRLGVDVGGTFTDVILVDQTHRKVWTTKVPTTPEDPSQGVINGIHKIFSESGLSGENVQFIGHGTTIATNLLVEGKGARTALVTTKGFRDVLEIRRSSRHDRADLYDMFFENPSQLVPRRHRYEVSCRMRPDGTELVGFDPAVTDRELSQMLDAGVEAVAVCLMHSYRNSAHEQRVVERIRKLLPDAFVTASFDVNPEIFEYERTSTTAINALLGPRCASYLRAVEQRIAKSGVDTGVHLMQSNGGLTRPHVAAERPVTLLESGPAGGVTASAKLCRRINVPNAITGDVGGTTFDVSLVRQFEPEIRQSTDISTYVVRAPTIDIVSIGAGGGSIASVDAAGGIQVGPRSAGANPGPACYKRGGELPTVTDCNLVLGYLSSEQSIGGYFLDVEASRQAISKHLATPLNISVEEAARTVRSIANAHMAQAMRLVTIERGYDPREFAYIAFGGGGPVHAVEVAEMLEVQTVIVPPHPGLFSAFGMLVADMVHDFQTPGLRNIEDLTREDLNDVYQDLEAKAMARMAESGISRDIVELQLSADCRYLGQAESLNIPIPDRVFVDTSVSDLQARFTEIHQRTWNFTLARPVIVTNFRLRAVGSIGQYETGRLDSASTLRPVGARDVFFVNKYETIPCYQRADFSADSMLVGPAVIEESSTSLVLGHGHRARVDTDGNLFVELGAGK